MDEQPNPYYQQAEDFLAKYGIQFYWKTLGKDYHWGGQVYHYQITFARVTRTGHGKSWTLDFWGSIADCQANNEALHPYDVLSCISGDNHLWNKQAIIDAFGYDAYRMDTDAIIQQAHEMNRFFTRAALRDLEEIQ